MAGTEIGRLFSENSLIFSSLEFLFRFLPVFLAVYYLAPARARKGVLFVGSILLYACCEPRYVCLLFLMTVLNYLFGRNMENEGDPDSPFSRSRRRQGRRRLCLIFAVLTDVGVLLFFKTGDLFARGIALPLGISFYTFKMISYQVDVYRYTVPAEKNFLRLGAWLCMFPQLTNGPIMRYGQTSEEPEAGILKPEQFEEGLRLLILGLASKVLLADRMGILWNDLQTIGFESISTPLAWLGAFTYSLRLYFDFEGYSLMAVGIGMMLGFPYIRNFNQPYMACTVSDFWRRWHMTLGSWFRDYVYIPLGGSRKGKGRQVLNLAIVWLLTGLWHGNGINFLIWGGLLGFLVILEKLLYGRILERCRLLGHLYVWLLIPLSWILFAVEDAGELVVYFSRLFPFFGIGQTLYAGDILKYLSTYGPLLLAGVFFCIPAVAAFYERNKKKWFMAALLVFMFWLSVYQITNSAGNPFMYFRF